MLSSSSPSSLLIRCRFTSHLSIHVVDATIPKISSTPIRLHHNTSTRQSLTDIDFHLTINRTAPIDAKHSREIDLATINLFINSTDPRDSHPSVLFIDWFLLSNKSSDPKEPLFRTPVHVQYDDIQTIVALTDYSSLINIAMLSMQIQQFPLRILAVNHSG